METKYYIHDGVSQTGPFTVKELSLMNLKANYFVWHENLSEWTPINTIDELKSILVKSPPEFLPKTNTSPPLTANKIQTQLEEIQKGINSDVKEHKSANVFKWLIASFIDLIPLFLLFLFLFLYENSVYKQQTGYSRYGDEYTTMILDILGFNMLIIFERIYYLGQYIIIPLLLLIYGLYFALMDSKFSGTIGKRIMRLKLVTTDDTTPTFGMVYRRYLLLVAFFGVLAIIQFLLSDYVFKIEDGDYNRIKYSIINKVIVLITLIIIIVVNKGQCFHDKVIGTKKVKK
jgi:uncharacterized RDD family membrane protein YckC